MQSLLKPIGRGPFDRIVAATAADKHCKGFAAWHQLVVMMYAQLSGASSLRQVEAGFNAHQTHHYHLGAGPVARSTLADANAKRRPAVFAALARALMSAASRQLRSDARALMYVLDSTAITLKGREFNLWTADNANNHTQGVKLHVQYALDTGTPTWHDFSAPNVNDVVKGRDVPVQAGARYIFDKGYCDYNWWACLNQQGAHFVTRFKRNAGLIVESEQSIPAGDSEHILVDRRVRFGHRHPRGGKVNAYQTALRYIEVVRPDHPTPLVLATNDMNTPARSIAEQYQWRWQVELFFKWIKQHLSIKSFLGRSQNAVHIQILTALISYLLVAMYRQSHGLKQSLWMVLSQLRVTLFQVPSADAQRYRQRREREAFFTQHQPPLFT